MSANAGRGRARVLPYLCEISWAMTLVNDLWTHSRPKQTQVSKHVERDGQVNATHRSPARSVGVTNVRHGFSIPVHFGRQRSSQTKKRVANTGAPTRLPP